MNATAIPGRLRSRSAVAAARGALVGVAVLAVWLLAYRLAETFLPAGLYADRSENTLGLAVIISLPASPAVAWLTSWAVHLRRPWLIALTGLVLAPIFAMLLATLTAAALTETAGLLAAILTVLATYAALATFSGPATRH
jgi:hypothetical protein